MTSRTGIVVCLSLVLAMLGPAPPSLAATPGADDPASPRPVAAWAKLLVGTVIQGSLALESLTVTHRGDVASVEAWSPERYWRLASLITFKRGAAQMSQERTTDGRTLKRVTFELALGGEASGTALARTRPPDAPAGLESLVLSLAALAGRLERLTLRGTTRTDASGPAPALTLVSETELASLDEALLHLHALEKVSLAPALASVRIAVGRAGATLASTWRLEGPPTVTPVLAGRDAARHLTIATGLEARVAAGRVSIAGRIPDVPALSRTLVSVVGDPSVRAIGTLTARRVPGGFDVLGVVDLAH